METQARCRANYCESTVVSQTALHCLVEIQLKKCQIKEHQNLQNIFLHPYCNKIHFLLILISRHGKIQTSYQRSSPLTLVVYTAATQRPNRSLNGGRTYNLKDRRRCVRSRVKPRVSWWFPLKFRDCAT